MDRSHLSLIDVSGRPLIDARDRRELPEGQPGQGEGGHLPARAGAGGLPAKIKASAGRGARGREPAARGPGRGLGARQQRPARGSWLPQYAKLFPTDELTDAGKVLQAEGEGYLLPSVVNNGGPVFIYNPAKVKAPPKSVDEFKAWAKANPGKFMYARPANSGPGRSILCGLPFILGDKKPNDPVAGWDKTWAFLKENRRVGSSTTRPAPRSRSRSSPRARAGSSPVIMEWDMKPRAEGTIPPVLEDLHPAQHVVRDRRPLLDDPQGRVGRRAGDRPSNLMKFMRRPDQQVLTVESLHRPVDQGGHPRQGAARHPEARRRALAAGVHGHGQEVQDRPAAAGEGADRGHGPLGQGGRRAAHQEVLAG